MKEIKQKEYKGKVSKESCRDIDEKLRKWRLKERNYQFGMQIQQIAIKDLLTR